MNIELNVRYAASSRTQTEGLRGIISHVEVHSPDAIAASAVFARGKNHLELYKASDISGDGYTPVYGVPSGVEQVFCCTYQAITFEHPEVLITKTVNDAELQGPQQEWVMQLGCAIGAASLSLHHLSELSYVGTQHYSEEDLIAIAPMIKFPLGR